jgi:DNA (cytosine-5)-methyltransferase 1
MTPTCVDLFAGAAGGWTLGLHRAGFRTTSAVESEAWRRRLYSSEFPDVKMFGDIRGVKGRQLGKPWLIAGSPPCREFSSVNNQAGGLDADNLFLEAVRLIDECRPRWVALENSAFVKTRGYDRIASYLEEIGYPCWPLVVGNGNAGARHRRPRLFLLARNTEGSERRTARQPRPPEGMVGHADPGPADTGRRGDAFDDLPRLGPAGTPPLGGHIREYAGVSTGLVERIREAIGDAVSPVLTEAVGRAILAVEDQLHGL